MEEEPKKEATEVPVEDQKQEQPSATAEAAPQANAAEPTAQPEGVPEWLKVNKAWEGADSYPIRMQLPKAGEASPRTAEFAADSDAITAAQEEYLLPKPSLDFEQFPGLEQQKTKLFSGKARRSLSGPIGVLVVIVLLLIAAGIATYRMGWLSGASGKSANGEPKVSVTGGSVSEGNVGAEATASPLVENQPARAERQSEPRIGGTTDSGIATAGKKRNESRTSVNARPNLPGGNKGTTTTSVTKDGPTNGAPQEGVYVPPKLIKAVRSLSPPEALRAHVSGIVTLAAVVDETGKVQSATPISGPKALYQKAVDTAKEYVYQPATKNGKPVPANVEMKIQFWYEP